MDTQKPTSDYSITMELWNSFDFPEKKFCSLNENQEITLNGTDYFEARSLSEVNLENWKTVIALLAEKFNDVESKALEVFKEWESTEDKVKFSGKIIRLKEYLSHSNALGDYVPIYEKITGIEKEIESAHNENYGEKIKLVEKAEELMNSEDWRVTSEAFRLLIEEWKNTASIVKNKSDILWERIDKARTYFFEKKRAFQESLEQEMMRNLDLKLEICENAEDLAKSNHWRKATEEFKELIDKWKKIGRVVSIEKNEELWNRFMNARNAFFERKKVNFEQIQQEQESNYNKKLVLVEKAESAQNNTDWKTTSDLFFEIGKEWKTIGRVPPEKSDELWNRLQAARDVFFGNKRKSVQEFKINLEDNYAQKVALCSRAEQIKNSVTWRETTDEMNELMREWKSIGPIPREYSDEIWEKFITARNHFFLRKDREREKRQEKFYAQIDRKLQQTQSFLDKISNELNDDEDRLEEFKSSLNNISGEGAKDKELRTHLESLIKQLESRIPSKKEKVADVEKQLEDLRKKNEEIQKEKSSG